MPINEYAGYISVMENEVQATQKYKKRGDGNIIVQDQADGHHGFPLDPRDSILKQHGDDESPQPKAHGSTAHSVTFDDDGGNMAAKALRNSKRKRVAAPGLSVTAASASHSS